LYNSADWDDRQESENGKIKFTYYQENEFWVGCLEEYPHYRTQGVTLDGLKDNLKDIYEDLKFLTVT